MNIRLGKLLTLLWGPVVADPAEHGLAYVATAIIVAAVILAIF